MQVKIEEILVSDERVSLLEIDQQKNTVTIFFLSSYHIIEKKRLGMTKISVYEWSNFVNVKYIYNEYKDETSTVTAKKYDEMETFRFIQEIDCKDNITTFRGWSDETGNWMTYEFVSAKIRVEILEQ